MIGLTAATHQTLLPHLGEYVTDQARAVAAAASVAPSPPGET